MTTRLLGFLLASVVTLVAVPCGATSYPTFGFVPWRSSWNTAETTITRQNVAKLRVRWQISLGTVADSSPILLDSVNVGGVIRTVLYQTATNGTTFAIDASNGRKLWHFATSPYDGITDSTPVAEQSRTGGYTAIYVPSANGYIYKLDPGTGHELAGRGFPARLTKIPQTEKDNSPLNIANGYLYAATSGYNGDAPYYDGHVLAVNLKTGVTHVFNSLCSELTVLPTSSFCPQSDSGIWGRGGVVLDPDPSMNGEIYAVTGNGFYGTDSNYHYYGDTLLGLNPDATVLLGHYTPHNYQDLDYGDIDMGSTSPGVLPRQKNSKTPLMLVQGGKDAILRLIDRSPLRGVGHELQELAISSQLFGAPAVWTDRTNTTWVAISLGNGNYSEMDAYRLTTNAQGVSRLTPAWRSTAGYTNGEGTSPVVADGIVFIAMDNNLLALDSVSGHELWSSKLASAGKTIGPVHWQSPIVANGMVFCSDQNGMVTAYALPAAAAGRGMLPRRK